MQEKKKPDFKKNLNLFIKDDRHYMHIMDSYAEEV